MNARDLTNHLAALLRRERYAMADFLVALADFDRRRRWADLGHASVFSFLRRELGLSAGAAQYRKTAAELIQHHPEVEAALREGRLCLSSVIELAKVLTPENVAEVLPRFFGLSSRDAAAVAVSIRPIEDPPEREVVTPIRLITPAPKVAAAFAPSVQESAAALHEGHAAAANGPRLEVRAPEAAAAQTVRTPDMLAAGPCTMTEPRPTLEPLDAERARLHITVSRRLLAKLEAALDLLLVQRDKRMGIVEKPRRAAAPLSSETIPAAVKRKVWTRAGGRCEWPLDSGGVCGSTLRLELDHLTPRAHGGPSTIDNLRVTCRFHNQLAARQAFGEEWMARFKRSARDANASAMRQREAPAE